MHDHISIEAIEAWCKKEKGRFNTRQVEAVVIDVYGLEHPLNYPRQMAPYGEARKCFSWFSMRLTTYKPEAIGMRIKRSRSSVVQANGFANDLLQTGDEAFTSNIIKTFQHLQQLHEKV